MLIRDFFTKDEIWPGAITAAHGCLDATCDKVCGEARNRRPERCRVPAVPAPNVRGTRFESSSNGSRQHQSRKNIAPVRNEKGVAAWEITLNLAIGRRDDPMGQDCELICSVCAPNVF
jgi:hypothetical protein